MTRREFLRWCGWFFAGNALLFWVLGLRYWNSLIPWLESSYLYIHDKILLSVFLLISHLGQLGLLVFLPAILIVPLILIVPRRCIIFPVAIFLVTCGAFFLISDSIVYGLYRFHLNGIILNLFVSAKNEQFFDFSNTEYEMTAAIILCLLLAESVWAYGLERLLRHKNFLTGRGKSVAFFVGLCAFFSYIMPIQTFGHSPTVARIMLETVQALPFYTEFLGAVLPVRHGQTVLRWAFDPQVVESWFAPQNQGNSLSLLRYPLHPLRFGLHGRQYNLVIIGIDSWRFDMLNREVTPHILRFAKQAWMFKNHFSGGDATAPGIFSLFYGIPAMYWSAMEMQHHGPVLIDELLKRHYRMEILSSAGLTLPRFNRTVFQKITNLPGKLSGTDPSDRDISVTQKFAEFIDRTARNKQPFFSFLLYDSAHSYCAVDMTKPFQPVTTVCDRLTITNQTDPLPYLNRYKNSLHFIDQQVASVIDTLKSHHLLENTIVIVTGDHGEEFNDNHLGYWGHASNFTRYQIQTPLIVYWPNEKPATFFQQTSHFDIVPTLMEKLLGCQSPRNDYTFGSLLFDKKPHSYLVEGSYTDFAVVEKDRITTVFPTGNFQITGLTGRPVPNATLRISVAQDAFQSLRQFYGGHG